MSRWLIKDITTEEKDVLIKSKIEVKQLKSAVPKLIKSWLDKKMDSEL